MTHPAAQSIFDLTAADIQPTRDFAQWCDAHDPLAAFRSEFAIPTDAQGKPLAYLVGNSLGVMPHAARTRINEELDDWAKLGAEGHLYGCRPWVSYHELFRAGLAELTGAHAHEVVAMNTLTANLHFLLLSFYQPTATRRRIIIERGAFPSDRFAVHSLVRMVGGDVHRDVIELAPRSGEECLRNEDIEATIDHTGDALALVILGGVQYYSGQVLDMPRITRAAHRAGAKCGWDLAHAIGNVPLALHSWGADFACWCSYKYLNGGPGAVAGAFVHERHHADPPPRLEGWWGTNPATRFEMGPDFDAGPGADAWQVSNPPIFSLAPLLASFDIFHRAGLDRLQAKSRAMNGFIEIALRKCGHDAIRVLTPSATHERGCQLSLIVAGGTPVARAVYDRLLPQGIACDFRYPSVIRVAPVPLYNTFDDCWRLIAALTAQ
ncbi:MAG: kynureninase [Phycisphaerales bacterium]|nr:kynureninase [Phycisphaerales bacterium]